MTDKIWSMDSVKDNLEQLLSEAEKNSPRTIQIGRKRFQILFLGEKEEALASERLAAGGPLDKDES
ncbi:hypothetical protein [Ochrobactrum chromiisoli]|uniref:Prevent-host-death protein n=1 Tax=Ochrobactrum chromiisoli TaxID=2993941 RepID=A0ABT3QSN3_9HYPH|nr:hypothetical protein [Ochrobactrum chromiisoli]MCX2698595.1 hypothetical protein [Ochrobactrum chromiisoli]